jgi:hypothetical protein
MRRIKVPPQYFIKKMAFSHTERTKNTESYGIKMLEKRNLCVLCTLCVKQKIPQLTDNQRIAGFLNEEKEGFEPSAQSPVRLISNQVHSTTLALLRRTAQKCVHFLKNRYFKERFLKLIKK